MPMKANNENGGKVAVPTPAAKDESRGIGSLKKQHISLKPRPTPMMTSDEGENGGRDECEPLPIPPLAASPPATEGGSVGDDDDIELPTSTPLGAVIVADGESVGQDKLEQSIPPKPFPAPLPAAESESVGQDDGIEQPSSPKPLPASESAAEGESVGQDGGIEQPKPPKPPAASVPAGDSTGPDDFLPKPTPSLIEKGENLRHVEYEQPVSPKSLAIPQTVSSAAQGESVGQVECKQPASPEPLPVPLAAQLPAAEGESTGQIDGIEQPASLEPLPAPLPAAEGEHAPSNNLNCGMPLPTSQGKFSAQGDGARELAAKCAPPDGERPASGYPSRKRMATAHFGSSSDQQSDRERRRKSDHGEAMAVKHAHGEPAATKLMYSVIEVMRAQALNRIRFCVRPINDKWTM